MSQDDEPAQVLCLCQDCNLAGSIRHMMPICRGGNAKGMLPDVLQDSEGHQLLHSLSLEIVDGPCSGAIFAPSGMQLAVGRTKASQIWIKDSAVSEKHAVFVWEQAAWTLRDMGSSNGTLVNGRALVGEGPSVQLKDGDVIQFGTDTRARVEVVPVCDENVTVEQYLEAEMQRQVQKIKACSEQFANQIKNEFTTFKTSVLSQAA